MTQQIDYSKSRSSVIVISLGFLIIYFLKGIDILLYLTIAISFAGLISKVAADKIHFVWMKLAWILSLIFPPILLGIIFYLFLTPIALLSKIISGKDLLKLKNSNQSTFTERNKTFEKDDFGKTW